jgi:hypothetical protein
MPSRAEVLGDGPIGGEEALGVSWGFKALHAPLPLAGRLVGVFGAVVEVAVLPMFDPGEQLPLRGAVARELVREMTRGTY